MYVVILNLYIYIIIFNLNFEFFQRKHKKGTPMANYMRLC